MVVFLQKYSMFFRRHRLPEVYRLAGPRKVRGGDRDTLQAPPSPDQGRVKRQKKKGLRKGKRPTQPAAALKSGRVPVAFPKYAISKCLRFPQGIPEQNASKECTY